VSPPELRFGAVTLVLLMGLAALTSCSSQSDRRAARSSSTTTPLGDGPASQESGVSALLAPPTTPVPNSAPAGTGASTGLQSASPQQRMFAFYYLWWDTAHWHARLGPSYPYNQSPPPLPAALDASGCHPTSVYQGNQLTDVASPLFTQSDPAQILRDVQQAASAGLAGFAVAWAGTGLPNQNVNSTTFNQRLAMVVQAVHQVNQGGTPFKLWIAYMSSARIRTPAQIDNDLEYLDSTYGSDPVFDRTNSPRMTLILMGSRKYPQSVLDGVSAHWRPHFYLVADENWGTWNKAKSDDFDADQYYWSSETPSQRSYSQVVKLAAEVRASRNPDGSAKRFFGPLAPGYDKQLAGGSDCVPRDGGLTMRSLYTGNLAAQPDGWMVISWNEIDEGTYILPLERYGTQSLDTLRSLIEAGGVNGR